jgi:hypothetical protein
MSRLSTRWPQPPGELEMAAVGNCVRFWLVYLIYGLDADFHISWIYTLYLAMDANFRLKLRNRHIKNDPELGPGWAYCANEKHYQNEMDQYGDQTEVSLIHLGCRTSLTITTD